MLKKYQKLFFWGLLVVLFFFLLNHNFVYQSSSKEKIEEEVIPIRSGAVITEFKYYITIQKEVKDEKLILSTHILESIFHYKNIESIGTIQIYVVIKSHSSYYIDRIYLMDQNINLFIQDMDYQKKDGYYFLLTKEFFQMYQPSYEIQIDLKKDKNK